MKKHHIETVCRDLPAVGTARLILRRLRVADTDDLYELAHQPVVSEYLLWEPHHSRKYTRAYLSDLVRMYRSFDYYEWGVEVRESGKLIGTCGFTKFDFQRNAGEIGYSLNPAYWGHGYATEAVAATLRFGFDELQLSRIEAFFAVENGASARVLARCGMQFAGESEPMYIKGTERRVGIYRIGREEYYANGTGETVPPSASDLMLVNH